MSRLFSDIRQEEAKNGWVLPEMDSAEGPMITALRRFRRLFLPDAASFTDSVQGRIVGKPETENSSIPEHFSSFDNVVLGSIIGSDLSSRCFTFLCTAIFALCGKEDAVEKIPTSYYESKFTPGLTLGIVSCWLVVTVDLDGSLHYKKGGTL